MVPAASAWPRFGLGMRLLQFLGGLPLVAAEFGDLRDHLGADPRHQSIGFFAFVATAPATRWCRRAVRPCLRPVDRGPDPGSSGGNLLRLGRPSAAPPATEAPTPADYAIQLRSPVGGCGIGREYLGGLTMARSIQLLVGKQNRQGDRRRRYVGRTCASRRGASTGPILSGLPLLGAQVGDHRERARGPADP